LGRAILEDQVLPIPAKVTVMHYIVDTGNNMMILVAGKKSPLDKLPNIPKKAKNEAAKNLTEFLGEYVSKSDSMHSLDFGTSICEASSTVCKRAQPSRKDFERERMRAQHQRNTQVGQDDGHHPPRSSKIASHIGVKDSIIILDASPPPKGHGGAFTSIRTTSSREVPKDRADDSAQAYGAQRRLDSEKMQDFLETNELSASREAGQRPVQGRERDGQPASPPLSFTAVEPPTPVGDKAPAFSDLAVIPHPQRARPADAAPRGIPRSPAASKARRAAALSGRRRCVKHPAATVAFLLPLLHTPLRTQSRALPHPRTRSVGVRRTRSTRRESGRGEAVREFAAR
jgi:hypothetical protein